MIYTCGGFGTNYQPAAFDVVTRAIRHELPRLLKGWGNGYVVDFYGISLRQHCGDDMESFKRFLRRLLGELATRNDKSDRSQRLKLIGWLFDLLHQRVTLSTECLEKALHGFMSVNEFEPLPLKTVQRLASWGVRYGTIVPLMHPFTSCLYNEIRGRSNQHSTVTLSPTARVAVHMLRALTLLMGVDEPTFSRPFESWVPPETKAGIVVEKDASLLGLGLLFFAVDANGSERLVGVSEVDIRSLGFEDDSGMQNTAEYITYVGGTRGAAILRDSGLLVYGEPPRGTWFRGDSTTALSWMKKGRVRSELAVNASLVALMQMIKVNMPLLGAVHLPKELNTRADRVSRRAETNLSLRELIDSDRGMVGTPILDLKMQHIVPLCDPMRRLDTPQALEAFWSRAQAALV
jgi:hypothetical protein